MVLWLTIVCLTKKNSKQLKKHKNEYIWSYIHVDGCGVILRLSIGQPLLYTFHPAFHYLCIKTGQKM